MPRDKKNKNNDRANQNIQDIANSISQNMDNLYRATYMSSPQQSRDLTDLSDRINTNIDKIVNKNMETIGVPSVSKLYARMGKGSDNVADIVGDLDAVFNSGTIQDDLMETFMGNRYIKEFDGEIDTVCRYMPELEEALEVQKDCVLSADHFSKDFLTFTPPIAGIDEKVFTERMKDIKAKYKLARLCEEIYEDTSKYGEKFIYRVPYSTAIGKLLANKPDALVSPTMNNMREEYEDIYESTTLFFLKMDNKTLNIYEENNSSFRNVLSESSPITYEKPNQQEFSVASPDSALKNGESFNIGIEICKSNIIESAVRSYDMAVKKKKFYRESSMASHHLHEAETKKKEIEAKGNVDWGKNKPDKRMIATTANDGLINGNNKSSEEDIVKVTVPGCVVKLLNREQIIPIYIDDICMGYYYFEMRTNDDATKFLGFRNVLGDPLTNIRGDLRSMFNAVDEQRQDETIRYVASQLSSFIDKQFVNSNQDLAKEIYMILKYNDLFNTPSMDIMKVTFVPPEDIVHSFFKQDPTTHRGISDLEKSMIPAKLYCSLQVSAALGNLTRGYDRRAYYVKQTVDTNIAQALMNTINHIKKGNFGIRQFQSINNVLGILGQFNDFVIPTSGGDPPISFEVIPGQDIETPTDMMEDLKDSAVSQTGIPYEIIQTRKSVDYAMQLTMSSSKVLRFCYKRQELFQDILSELIGPIYNYEYDESITIKVELPPPSFINVTNTNQLIDNTKNMVQSIVDIELAGLEGDDADKIKNQYSIDLFEYYIGTHLDVSAHKKILEKAKMKVEAEKPVSHSDGNDSDY